MKKSGVKIYTLLGMTLAACNPRVETPPPETARMQLTDGWSLQSSAQTQATGEQLSTPGHSVHEWIPAKVPTTVFAALVARQVYPDPYFGMNLRSIPGVGYPIGHNFAKLPMPEDSPFRSSWWFRTEFELPASPRSDRSIALHFDGINFRANIWLNGQQLADTQAVAGAYRRYEFDVTGIARPGESNALAVEIYPPDAKDLAFTWVDWNPMAPDKGMGLWRDVYLTTSGPVSLRHPHVFSRLPSLQTARLSISVDVRNLTEQPIAGTLNARIDFPKAEQDPLQFAQPVTLAAGENRTVLFEPENFSQLTIPEPALWWPVDMGEQPLHDLELSFSSGAQISDQAQISDRAQLRFGIREVTSELTEEGHRLFRVNGRRVLVRGGGWTPDMMLRFSEERMAAELAYVQDMGLNAIRLEGKMEPEPFFELADRYGLLILAGWCCCSHWERWDDWSEEDHRIAAESLRSQILRLRGHPSLLVWLNGSDFPPPAKVEKAYLEVLEELRWPNPVLSSATTKPAEHSGPSGVKMNGPYEWIPPAYWLTDDGRHGGAWGFATEVGPGPVVPPFESLREMLPESSLWPMDEQWSFHAGGGRYKELTVFSEALSARYGTPEGARDYAFKAQLMAYEGLRAMFEAYGREKYRSTGVIQWMLNDAWPSMIWHLYDFYLRPGGAYFGAKKALETVHVQYSYDDRSIVIVNGHYEGLADLEVTASLYDLEMRQHFTQTEKLDVPADSSTRAFVVPEVPPDGHTSQCEPDACVYFLKLELNDGAGKLLSSNFYWISTQPDVLDWDASTWFYTPVQQHADFTQLHRLPQIELEVTTRQHPTKGEEGRTSVRLRNPNPHLAFGVHLRLTRGEDGPEVLPILWDDNYFELLPGAEREIHARYRQADLQNSKPFVGVDGWNVARSQHSESP